MIKYRKDILDTKSKSFCGAKWYNATTWLGSGTTASCHHPPAHKIPLHEIAADPSAIHNTQHKKAMRKMMQRGERPRECEYCWKVEDMGNDAVSDRVFKSIIYTNEDVKKARRRQGITEKWTDARCHGKGASIKTAANCHGKDPAGEAAAICHGKGPAGETGARC